ncbi:MAG TPA: endolytic transglycosylase MltG [Syntrophomonas sp.]|nr:endolytic transglycosylase MltG [Syntrophomonas sp.]
MSEIKVMRKKNTMLMLAALLILLSLGLWGGQLLSRQYQPVDPGDLNWIDLNIPPASNAAGIAALLKSQDLIRNEDFFLAYCRQQGLDNQLKAGHYRFSRSQGLAEIASAIAEGRVVKLSLTIPEGYTVDQIGELLVGRGICSPEEWKQVAGDDYDFSFLKAQRSSAVKHPLEGFLFPDTYTIEESTSAKEIVKIMLTRFETVWNDQFAGLAQAQNRNMMEVVTTASLIEEEAGIASERAQIAGVIKNRLDMDMLLQIDATVLYCLGTNKPVVTYADLQVNSPYNTYLYPGLPPGPIACPGQASIQAALAPENHHYLYYVARGDGSHEFTATFGEHLAAQRRYAN